MKKEQTRNVLQITLLWLPVLIKIISSNPQDDLHLNCSILVLENTTSEFYGNALYVLWDNHADNELVPELAKQTYRPIILSDRILNSSKPYHRIIPFAYFIYSSNYSSFESMFSRLNKTHVNWQPRSKFVVLVREIAPAEKNIIVENIVRTLYAVNVHSFVILISFDENLVNIYTWDPFAESSYCGKFIRVIKINECTGNKLAHDTNLYQRSVLNNKLLSRCVLRVGAFNWPPYTIQDESTISTTRNFSRPKSIKFVDGYHVQTIQILSRVYNLRVQYVSVEDGARWGTLLDNGTWTGGLGDLQTGKADVVIGGALQTPLRFSNFDCSSTYSSLFFKVYLPMPVKLPHWKNMIHVFSLTFWIIISTIYVVTSIFICNLSRISGNLEKAFFNSYLNCFLTLWRIAIGHPANCIPKSKPVRVVFLPWLVYSLHITLVYTSALLGFISTPIIHESIKDIKQLSSSGLTLLVVPEFIQVSHMMDEEFTSFISKKFQSMKSSNYTTAIERLITEKDVAIFDPEEHFEMTAKEKVFQVHSFDVMRFTPGMYVRKGSIYLKYLEKIQLRVRENGLFSKWQADIIGAYKYRKHQRVDYQNEVLPLTLEELSGSFYILIFGLSLGLIVFCLEIMAHKFKPNSRK